MPLTNAEPNAADGGIWARFEHRLTTHADALFAVDEHGAELTFAAAHREALQLAVELEGRGIGPGSVVSWQFPNRLDGLVLTIALCRLGATQCPLIPILRHREVSFICRQARTDLIVVPSEPGVQDFVALVNQVAADVGDVEVMVLPATDRTTSATVTAVATVATGPIVAAPTDPHAVRWYYYTSGTTADPKGARHTDASLIATARGFVDALAMTADDRVSMLLPLTHIGGISHVIAAALTGAPIITSSAFDPVRTPGFLREQRATTIPGSPPFVLAYFSYADAHPDQEPLFPDARIMMHGGSPKAPALYHRAKQRFGAGILSGYGMTECPHAVWNRPGDSDDEQATSEGRPTLGIEMRIVDASGSDVGPDVEGEVRLKGPQLMAGYVDSTLDAAAFDDRGFMCSGDLGVRDEHGRLRITGRTKDIIIRNMENVSALEVENLLYAHPKVKEAAVIGLPDETTGERICAVVVPETATDPPTLGELATHLLEQGLSKRKLPEQLELMDALPRNAMEKIRKVDLRERFGARPVE